MKTNNLIYALKCPFTDSVHYIGKSTQGMLRPMQHLSHSHSLKVREWVEDISMIGYLPKIEILQFDVNIEDLDDSERYWIDKYINEGALLLNIQLISYSDIIESKSLKSNIISNDEFLNSLSEIVKNRRRATKLSQEDFAKKIGFGLRWIRKVEQFNNNIMLSQVQKLLSFLGYKLTIEKL